MTPIAAVRGTSEVVVNHLPPEVQQFAEALAARHGSILASREKNGLHLNMACPSCLNEDGVVELKKRHLAVNAEKFLRHGQWEHEEINQKIRDRAAQCMKRKDHRFKISNLLTWPPLVERGIKESVAKVRFVDNTHWLVDDGKGNIIPGGPGNGSPGDVVPINILPEDHPAVCYLRQRGYDLESLWQQFRCSYCVQEWRQDRQAGRFYRRMPEGFWDSPQGRIIFFADMEGVQKGWQARIIDHAYEQDGVRYKAFWNGHTNQWHTMECWSEEKGKYVALPQYTGDDYDWDPSKYRTANGSQRNELIFGLDAAIAWNKQQRPHRMPIVLTMEGPLDAGRARAPAVAHIGKWLSDQQAAVLARHFAVALHVPDNDQAGEENMEHSVKLLGKHMEAQSWRVPGQLPGVPSCKDMGDVPQPLADVFMGSLLRHF